MTDFELTHITRNRNIGPKHTRIKTFNTDFSAKPLPLEEVEVEVNCSKCDTAVIISIGPTDRSKRWKESRDTFYMIGIMIVAFLFGAIVSFTEGEILWGVFMSFAEIGGIALLIIGYKNLNNYQFSIISIHDAEHIVKVKNQ